MTILRKIAKDLILGRINLSVDELSTERMKICESCPAFKKMLRQCSLCNCLMDLKTKIPQASCPLEKW